MPNSILEARPDKGMVVALGMFNLMKSCKSVTPISHSCDVAYALRCCKIVCCDKCVIKWVDVSAERLSTHGVRPDATYSGLINNAKSHHQMSPLYRSCHTKAQQSTFPPDPHPRATSHM